MPVSSMSRTRSGPRALSEPPAGPGGVDANRASGVVSQRCRREWRRRSHRRCVERRPNVVMRPFVGLMHENPAITATSLALLKAADALVPSMSSIAPRRGPSLFLDRDLPSLPRCAESRSWRAIASTGGDLLRRSQHGPTPRRIRGVIMADAPRHHSTNHGSLPAMSETTTATQCRHRHSRLRQRVGGLATGWGEGKGGGGGTPLLPIQKTHRQGNRPKCGRGRP